jgi:hemerythrin-like metal-binding protein
MNKIEWNSKFELGFHDIDQHHERLVGLLSRTHEEFDTGTPNLGRTLNELLDYTKYHFSSEELWMLDGLYPAIIGHKKEHIFFLAKVTKIRDAYRSGNESLSLEMLLFLESWITKHILKTDAEFGKFLRKSAP